MLPPIAHLKGLLARRITMLEGRGFDVEGLAADLAELPDGYDPLLALARRMVTRPRRPGVPWVEPEGYPEILASLPAPVDPPLSPGNHHDRVSGAVHGRIAGCILGKPLEMGLRLPEIRCYLEGAGAWPLEDFVPGSSPTQTRALRADCGESTRGNVRFAQEDDDINYLVLGVRILETCGRNFTTRDVARSWIRWLPYGWCWGPEHLAYHHAAAHLLDTERWESLPQGDEWLGFPGLFSAWEEEIGAMIRADAWGLACPGRPDEAARMAWTDAVLTHRRNGIYAARWTAATLAAAVAGAEVVDAIRCGLTRVPPGSRFADCVRRSLDWSLADDDWLTTWGRIDEAWGPLGHAGTLNETAAIVNALVHARRPAGLDFTAAITTAVMQGWDTDCSAATVGSIAGACLGLGALPRKWVDPFRDTFYTSVAEYRGTSIAGLAARLAGLGEPGA